MYTNSIAAIVTDADLYIFSLSDSALPDVINQMQPNGALWIHTAGSMPMDVFADKCARYGVLYPMQTVNKDRVVDWSDVPIFVEASNEDDTQYLVRLSQRLSNNVSRSNSQQRQSLHLAAVFACNFTNHMYALSASLLEKQGLPFDAMLPLIDETSRKVHELSPAQAQTGPAIRRDKNVLDKHLSMLQEEPVMKELYEIISKNIQEL
jgi:predicted short-subunit dehydrogenase-like oxidoreductase (DUF2520 family)